MNPRPVDRGRGRRLGASLFGAALLFAACAAAQESAPAVQTAPIRETTSAAAPAPAPPAADDPCVSRPDGTVEDYVTEGLDWTRRQLFSSVCVSARWFDRFFGEERFDEGAAQGVQGYAYYQGERRAGSPVSHNPGLRLRVALPNLNKRLHFFVDREEDRKTIEGQSETVDSGLTSPVAPREESSQFGFGYLKAVAREVLLKFRVGIRAKGGRLEPFVQGQFQNVFAQTNTTRWRVRETLFWRRTDGAGETTSLDFEASLRKDILFRWFNDATVSETTELVGWLSGTSLYFDLGDRRAVQAQFTVNGDTGAPVDVANYGVRLAYRRSLGRPWLMGEAYIGHDYPKPAPEVERLSQTFVGLRLELQFDRGPEPPRPGVP
jgi:hypothetical protein